MPEALRLSLHNKSWRSSPLQDDSAVRLLSSELRKQATIGARVYSGVGLCCELMSSARIQGRDVMSRKQDGGKKKSVSGSRTYVLYLQGV